MENIKENELYIEKLNFSVRSYNCLKRNNINTVKELLEVPVYELEKFRNLGAKSLEEINNVILKLKSSDFVFEDKEFTVLDILADSEKKISKILFYYESEEYGDDIKIKDMKLSVRSLNALKLNGYQYASQLVELRVESLNEIKNLGEKCRNEIIDTLKSVVHIIYDQENIKENDAIQEIINVLLKEYEQSLVEYDKRTLKSIIYMKIKTSSVIIDVVCVRSEELINNKEFLDIVYDNNILRDLLKKHIFRFVKKMEGLINLPEIMRNIPNHLKNSDIIKNIINELIETKRIEQYEGNYRISYPILSEYINSLEIEREKTMLYERFRGKTLEETGSILKVTRERVRQLEKKVVKKIPRVREDDYKESFEKYEWTSELFRYAYNESDLVYGYLKYKYNRGNKSPEDILEDYDITIQIRLRAEKIIFKDYIMVGSSWIKKDRQEILEYILRNYCKDEVTSQDLSDLYYMFLEDYSLHEINKFMYPKRYFESTLANSKKVLWKYGKKLRKYDFTEMNAQRIVNALNLSQFENVEYSTLKFFNDYIEIMEEWDIRDEYELHNLMKKVFLDNNNFNIILSRMPNIEFGKPDRDMQVMDILLETAPIESYELAKAYEKEYGVKTETAVANYFKSIDGFYHNGLYTIDSEGLLGNEFIRVKEKLEDDIYLIKDVREIYIKLFPMGNPKLINPYNLKRLGFKVNTGIIYSDKFTNLEQYFRTIMLNNDIFDATLLDSRFTCWQAYYNSLQMLKGQFEIVEFLPNEFVNIRRLEQKGIGKEKLQEFIDDVYEFVVEELFTIKSLRKKGFEHRLDELGFDNWFYSALLRCDTRFKYRKIDGNFIFRKGADRVNLNDLVEQVVCKYRSIDIFDLIENISSVYGITIERYKIPNIAKEKELYYNAIMEKIYIDYDEYFEEV
ncbi:hypothetical protein KPL35_15110 [Clostridium sp. CF011]|uniref:DNA-directed RNA polymerase subunit alpha C-terminal domain-containing protein n=1 Tax=Clostridium sp. CF011 TaxID=2843318 RepID=UPI001C0E0669|nr:hypothetical protein [Clostridium sp. CF011]